MNMRKIRLFTVVFVGYLITLPCIHASSVFQTMATAINQQLFPITQQTITQPSDPHMQQLIRSVFAQLQNTTQTKDIGNIIDVILNILEQRQEHQEIGVSLVVVVAAHSLRIIAQKLYRSISFVRKSLLYWKRVDQESLFRYCISHIPTVWNPKFNGGFLIKQNIVQTEKIYALYVAQLGLVSRLIHQLPKTANSAVNIAWINDALVVFRKYSSNQKITIPTTKPFNAITLLKHIKLFLGDFDQHYNDQFQQIKDAIGLPSYFSRSFGKIIAHVAIVGGTLFSAYYYANEIVTWSRSIFNDITEHVWSPIYKNVKAIFSTQEKDLLMDAKKLKLVIKSSNELELECVENLKDISPNKTEDELLKADILKYCPSINENEASIIVQKNNFKELYNRFITIKDERYTIWGSGSDSVNIYPIIISLLLRQLLPTAYKSEGNLAGIVSELAKALHQLDTDIVSLRKLAVLTPALFTVAGTYKAGSKMYEYATHKDYSAIKIAFKELETVTICAVNQPEHDSSYGLFIFLLESLKIGVVQILPSRYTERNELLEDLTRLESPDLTFKQRLKLIEQIRRSYSIFKQS